MQRPLCFYVLVALLANLAASVLAAVFLVGIDTARCKNKDFVQSAGIAAICVSFVHVCMALYLQERVRRSLLKPGITEDDDVVEETDYYLRANTIRRTIMWDVSVWIYSFVAFGWTGVAIFTMASGEEGTGGCEDEGKLLDVAFMVQFVYWGLVACFWLAWLLLATNCTLRPEDKFDKMKRKAACQDERWMRKRGLGRSLHMVVIGQPKPIPGVYGPGPGPPGPGYASHNAPPMPVPQRPPPQPQPQHQFRVANQLAPVGAAVVGQSSPYHGQDVYAEAHETSPSNYSWPAAAQDRYAPAGAIHIQGRAAGGWTE